MSAPEPDDLNESSSEEFQIIDLPSSDSEDSETSDPEDSKVQSNVFNIHFNPSLYENSVAVTPVYEGASMSVLQSLAELFDWFTSHPGSRKESLSDILHMQHHSLLPADNLLPDNYRSALAVIKPFLIQPIIFHVCPNDCILFRDQYSVLTRYPICGMNRYKHNNVPS